MEKQKKIIDLADINNCKWPTIFEFSSKPPSKVSSAAEIIDDIVLTALSSDVQLMAAVQEKDETARLFVIDFIKQRYFLIWEFTSAINAVKFEMGCTDKLILVSQCRKVFFIDILEGEMQSFEDHTDIPKGITFNDHSNLAITWSKKDALIWSTSAHTLKSKLVVDSDENIVWVYHLWKNSLFVAGFDTGTVMIWDELNDMKEYAITTKEDSRNFKAYAVSSDGEWMVGGGALPHLVIYSIASRIILRTIGINHLCPTLIFCQFLPIVQPHFTKVLLLLSEEGTVVVYDFIKCEKIKSLRSQNYAIRDICLSEEGYFMAISYDNGHTKMYPTLSFFPATEATERAKSCDQIAATLGEKRINNSIDETPLNNSTLPQSKSMSSVECREDRNKVEKNLKVPLDKSKWLEILREFNEFPPKYRRLIWTSILELPLNSSVVAGLMRKEAHPAVEVFQNYIHEDDKQLAGHFISTLSCLLHWAPCLASVNFLADFVRNFVILFKENSVHCFELCATVIFNWCRTWFECWPEPPIAIMHIIEQIVCDNDPELLVHLMRLKIDPEIYGWSLLSTGFSKVVSTSDYLILWDNILSNPPSFIICLAASFPLCLKKSLLSCSSHDEAKQLYQQESWLLPTLLLKKAYEIRNKLKINEKHRKLLDRVDYLPKGGLPSFRMESSIKKVIFENENNVNYFKKSKLKTNEPIQTSSKPEKYPKSSTGTKTYEDCIKKISRLRRKQVCRYAN